MRKAAETVGMVLFVGGLFYAGVRMVYSYWGAEPGIVFAVILVGLALAVWGDNGLATAEEK